MINPPYLREKVVLSWKDVDKVSLCRVENVFWTLSPVKLRLSEKKCVYLRKKCDYLDNVGLSEKRSDYHDKVGLSDKKCDYHDKVVLFEKA